MRRGLGIVAAVLGAAALVLLVREAAGAGESGGAGTEDTPSDPSEADLVAEGEQLFLTGCVTCHGVGGEGSDLAPSLIGVGEASADFQLRTGRMPATRPTGDQPPTKPLAYNDDEIRALVAYVGSLGEGPPIPDVVPSAGDLSQGGDLFRANCAACHNAAGIGGALSSGDYAPSLLDVDPTQIGEAMRVGPGQMPKFGPDEITDEELDSIVRYVLYLQQPADPGGFSLGGTGPTAEGFVAWVFGIGGAITAALFVTREKRRVKRSARVAAEESG
jgi:ubiquinol-cytochrome c reductase cytochrome c subunit